MFKDYRLRFTYEADLGGAGGGTAPEGEPSPEGTPPETPPAQATPKQVEEGGTEGTEGDDPLHPSEPGSEADKGEAGLEPEVDEEQVDVPPYPGSPEHQQEPATDPEGRRLHGIVNELTYELQQARSQLEEYQLADMDEDDRRILQLQQREEELTQRQQELQAREINNTWYDYYSQWPGVEQTDLAGQGPIEWQHAVLSKYANTVHNQQRKIEALQQALKGQQQAKPEPTTKGGASPVGRKTIYQTPWDEIERMHKRALKGQLTSEDYLPTT